MELTKTLVCCVLVLVILTEVIVCRPTHTGTDTELEALVRDIDQRLIKSEHKSSRRRRRHVATQRLAILEHCLRNRYTCRAEVERMRRLQRRNREFTVIVIEK